MRLITTIALALLGLTTWAQTSLPDLPAGALRYSQTLWIVPSDSTLWTGATGNYAQVATREQLRQLAAQGYTKSQVDSAITSQIGLIDFPVTSVSGKTGDVGLEASDVGLGNVDNTTDLDKPISTATQGALDGKENSFSKGSLVAGTGVMLDGTLANRLVGSGNVTINSTSSLTASNGLQIISGVISPQYGTLSGTVAQGNDIRINNGQTAFDWGNFRDFGLGTTAGTTNDWTTNSSGFIRNNTDAPVVFAAGINSGGGRFQAAGRFDNFYMRDRLEGTGWKEVWHDGNLDPSNYLQTSARGVANGVASLDGSGKVPSSQLPTGGMQYQGTWNASTNTPTLSNATGTDGHFYRVTTAGTQNLGSGNITFSVGDDVIHNGSVWQRAPSGTTSTNLAIGTRTATTMPITNSNGAGFTIPAATTSLAGLMSGADKTKLNSALTDETDPTVPAHVKAITSGQVSNWNTAYGWGDYRDYGLGLSGGMGIWGQQTDFTNALSSSSRFFGVDGAFFGIGSTQRPQGILYRGVTNTRWSWIGVTDQGDIRVYAVNSSNDTSPVQLWHDGNLDPSNYLLTSNFTWSNLSGKPSTFAPSPHSHSAADINSGTLAAARIGNATVSNAKLANMSANTIKGRSGSTGAPQDLTAAQVRTILNVADGATANATNAQLRNRATHTGTQAISTVSGLQSELDGKLSTSGGDVTRTVPGWPNSINDNSNNFVNTRIQSMVSNNSGLHFFGDGDNNARRFGIQVSHRSASFASSTGILELNPFGGNVYINGGLAAVSGTGSTQVRNNSQLDARYIQSLSGGAGINVSGGSTVSVDNTVVRTSGNQTIAGTKTFTSPVVAPQYQGTSTTASSSIPTNAQSLFKATISSNTNYTLTNLSGNPRQIQVMVTNTSGSTVYVNFSGGSVRMADGATDNVPASATVIFTFLIENGSAWGVKSTFL